MKRYWLLTTIGLGVALVSLSRADEVTPTSGFRKHQPPAACPPAPCPPAPCLPGQAMPGQPGVPGQPSMPPPGTLPPTGVTPPAPTPPGGTPPAPTPPGATPPAPTPAPASQAPSTESFAQAPAAGTTGSESFNPNMIGDLGAGSYICGFVPVTETTTVTERTFRNQQGVGFLQRTTTSSDGHVVSSTTVPFQFSGSGSTHVSSVNQSSIRKVLIPQVGRGSFKIAENESPRPTDRFFTTYNYFNNVGRGIPGVPLHDTHREVFGVEKTFLDGDASIGVRLNTLQSTGDGALGADVFGNMSIVSKFALINDPETGNVMSGGVVLTLPTGPDAILPDGSRLNPVLIQPWSGGIWNRDRFFVHGFSSLVLPTDSQDATLSETDLGLGYRLYQATDMSDSIITYVIPTVEGHATIALTKKGTDRQPVGVPDVFVATSGLHVGIGRATDLTFAMAVPISGPRTFDFEAIVQLNWRFGCSVNRPNAQPGLIGG